MGLKRVAKATPPASARLYGGGRPVADFNQSILRWLSGDLRLAEHATPKAFEALRIAYDLEVDNLLRVKRPSRGLWEASQAVLSNLTSLMLGNDISGLLSERLSAERINPRGFRTALAQGVAKNTGENFINLITYAVAKCLAHQDEVLVDKALPPSVRPLITLEKVFESSFPRPAKRKIEIKIESDLTIFSRSDPSRAIVVSAKTRLKEIFHIAVMWKLLFDSIGDKYMMKRWQLVAPNKRSDILLVFATADMIPPGGTRTQGPDVERDEVRNLIAMDAAFLDYVFVSKSGIPHVANELDVLSGREALFHELGCLLDLIEQKFRVAVPR